MIEQANVYLAKLEEVANDQILSGIPKFQQTLDILRKFLDPQENQDDEINLEDLNNAMRECQLLIAQVIGSAETALTSLFRMQIVINGCIPGIEANDPLVSAFNSLDALGIQ